MYDYIYMCVFFIIMHVQFINIVYLYDIDLTTHSTGMPWISMLNMGTSLAHSDPIVILTI